MPYRWQLTFAGPWLLVWLLPYAALRLGFAKPTRGRCVHVRFHLRGIQFVETGGAKQVGWSRFEAFDVGRWNGFDVLQLRFRGSWLSRRFGPNNVAIEFCPAQVCAASIREVLQDRGLREEPLGEPPASW